jgi:hypothetical protein
MSAENSNAENLLILRSPELAEKYTANWSAHLNHSEKYTGGERNAPRESEGRRRR